MASQERREKWRRLIMFAALSKMHAECFPNKPWTADDFAGLKKSGAEMAASDNGFAVWRMAGFEAEIITIGVRPAARRNGAADALVAIIEKDVRGRAKKIFLEVAKDNIAAIKLYEKNGFIKVGVRPKYYDGIDGIIMEKKV